MTKNIKHAITLILTITMFAIMSTNAFALVPWEALAERDYEAKMHEEHPEWFGGVAEAEYKQRTGETPVRPMDEQLYGFEEYWENCDLKKLADADETYQNTVGASMHADRPVNDLHDVCQDMLKILKQYNISVDYCNSKISAANYGILPIDKTKYDRHNDYDPVLTAAEANGFFTTRLVSDEGELFPKATREVSAIVIANTAMARGITCDTTEITINDETAFVTTDGLAAAKFCIAAGFMTTDSDNKFNPQTIITQHELRDAKEAVWELTKVTPISQKAIDYNTALTQAVNKNCARSAYDR